MERLTMGEALERVDDIRAALERDGAIVFPTDTIYGIGCLASSEPGLLAVRALKDRWGKPFSIIAPSKAWIERAFELGSHGAWLDKLPGRYTLVLVPKKPFSGQLSSNGKVGVRIPDHPIAGLVERLGVPLVATSVNASGLDPLTSLDGLEDPRYARFAAVAFAIDDGPKMGPASTVVDLTGERPVYLRM